jgi:hypothetical protein
MRKKRYRGLREMVFTDAESKWKQLEGMQELGGNLRHGMVLWCLHCDRSFPVEELRVMIQDEPGWPWDGDVLLYCKFADCDGAGFGFDLFEERWWAR